MAAWERDLVALVEARGPALSRYAYFLSCDRAEAADLVQEGLLRAMTRLGKVRDADRLEGYVRKAILNAYLDGQRRHKRWRTNEHLLVDAGVESELDELVAARQAVRAALTDLSPRQRACIVLRFYEDLTISAIADELGCSEGTVKRYVSDALAKLNSSLQLKQEELANDEK